MKLTSASQKGSIELVALGLLAALILVLALPLFSDVLVGDEQKNSGIIEYSLPR